MWAVAMSLLGDFWPHIVGFVGVIAVFFGARQSGKKSERNKQKVRDHERAEDIRNRVRNSPDDSLREHDDAGFRD